MIKLRARNVKELMNTLNIANSESLELWKKQFSRWEAGTFL